MSVRLPLLLAGGSLLVGAVLGWATHRPAKGPGRPSEVEAVLVMVDRDDAAGLRRALDAAGDPEGYPSPWRDELRMARLVERGDQDALWRFATAGEPGAAKARALVLLIERGKSLETRERALARLKLDYPKSWTVSGARSPSRPDGDGSR
jgi:hypothetical protein